MNLDACLRWMHRFGYWFDAWYPIMDNTMFECRITQGTNLEWAVAPSALQALTAAIEKVEVRP